MLLAGAVFMSIFGLIYFFWKESGGRKPLIFKALATFMPVLLAAYSAWTTKESSAWWMFAGILCYMAADVLLEIWFLTGVAFFGAGHICVMTGLLQKRIDAWFTGICFLFLIGLMFLVLRKYMGRLDNLLIPGLSYAVLLCMMAAMSVSTGAQARDVPGILLGIGGVCFVISDTILGWSHLSGQRKRKYSACLLVLYYLAVFLMAASVYLRYCV